MRRDEEEIICCVYGPSRMGMLFCETLRKVDVIYSIFFYFIMSTFVKSLKPYLFWHKHFFQKYITHFWTLRMTKNLGQIKIIFHWLGKTSTLGLQTFHSFYNGWKYITLLESVQHFKLKSCKNLQNDKNIPMIFKMEKNTLKTSKLKYIQNLQNN